MLPDRKDNRDEDHGEYIPGAQEKSSLGGTHNSGVTSEDPAEKDEIQRKGSMAKLDQKKDQKDNTDQS